MRRPLSLLPALVLAATAAVGLGPVPADAAAAAPRDPHPLSVTIESLDPSTVPARGRVRMRGTVTNASDERWRAINVHAFISAAPITSSGELAEAVTTPVEAEVGGRITLPGTFDDVGSLDPGETTRFSIRLRRDQLPVSAPGVYWFGAHALGNTEDARDGVADGRARTFLPLVPQATPGRVRATIVVPVRRAVRHTVSGRIRAAGKWADDLAPGGRLDALVAFGAGPGAGPVTWLVDPAVPDTVARLVAGNPARSLAARIDPAPPGDSEESDEPAEPDQTGDGDDADPAEDGEGGATGPRPDPAAEAGAAWLDQLRAALAGDEVLALPYGDPDLAAVAALDPSFYDRAVRRTGTQLEDWRVSSTPAVSSPTGYLPASVFDLVEDGTTAILSDQALDDPDASGVARIAGRRVLLAATATAQGGPGPEDRFGEIAMRQRILADAALRLLFEDRAPLVVVMPGDWRPDDPAKFWSGTDHDWLSLRDVDELGRARRASTGDLVYPVDEGLRELDEGSFAAAEGLIRAGQTLEGVLTDNDRVAEQTLDEALTAISYHDRDRALEVTADTVGATTWITNRLGNIRIRAPKGVTLSSANGSFAATLSNRLRHPVTVTVEAVSQGDVTVEQPAAVELPARGRQSVVFEASAATPGVHYVRLQVTDADGTPLGATQRVPIRSAQVSRVIWVILGVGVGLLFTAIAVRVVRRVRSERA